MGDFGFNQRAMFARVFLTLIARRFAGAVGLYLLSAAMFNSVIAADLDPTFGTAGRVRSDFGGGYSETVQKVLLQPDGKIIAVGSLVLYAPFPNPNNTWAFVARYNSEGGLDTNFGNGGKTIVDMGQPGAFFYDVALQSDGKIVAVGSFGLHSGGNNSDYLIVRFNANGSPDNGFDNDGIVTKGFGQNPDGAYGVVILPDGKIVVAGTSFGDQTSVTAILRYNSDSTIDNSFGVNGDGVSVVYNGGTRKMLMQPDGKFITLPYTSFGPTTGRASRLNSNGTLDFSFGSGGVLFPNFNGTYPNPANAIALQPDGKLLVAGSDTNGATADFKLTRYTVDGMLDTSFGVSGAVTTGFTAASADVANSVIVQADGRIVLSGTTGGGPQRLNFGLARYSSTGALLGKATTDFSMRIDTGTSLLLQPDGKIVMAGYTSDTNQFGTPTELDVAMARYVDITTLSVHALPFDFDGDYRANIGVYRPGATPAANSFWYILNADNNTFQPVQFGIGEDKIVPADYNGDIAAEIAVWRPSTGTWFTSTDPAINYGAFQWGIQGDIPIPGDFDGDAKADFAVFRPSTGFWYVRRSSDGGFTFQQFGMTGDKPLLADFDGDFKTDFAFVRSNGIDLVWNILQSSNGATIVQAFGLTDDYAVPVDFDGDGRANIAVFRASTGRWYTSLDPGTNYGEQAWGTVNDLPVSGDYDGDGKFDLGVFRRTNTFWYIRRSTNLTLLAKQWGVSTDIPIEFAYVR
jgi:uncharacterized delta-60 repeat protein